MIHYCASPNKSRAAAAFAVLLGLSAATIALAPGAAHSHAIIVAAEPGMNSTVPRGKLEIRLAFNSLIDFVIAGGIKATAAATIGLAVSLRPIRATATRIAIAATGALVLCEALANSHAAARFGDSRLVFLGTGAHELGAALWLGALPCLSLALRHTGTSEVAHRIGKRFSSLAVGGVSLIVFGAVVFAIEYFGSIDAAYGTAYGAMAVAKSLMFAMLLGLGYVNFRTLRRSTVDPAAAQRIRRFVDVEMGIGFAVLMAAASITSMPPAVDLVDNRVTFSELKARMTPTMPPVSEPGPCGAGDLRTSSTPRGGAAGNEDIDAGPHVYPRWRLAATAQRV
jgi:uncharacterized membrane protein